MAKDKIQNRIARIENAFVENAQYDMSVREQKVILYLISKIDPTQKNFMQQTLPIKEIEKILKAEDKKWGGLYVEMKKFQKAMLGQHFWIPTDIEVGGKNFEKGRNWFEAIDPIIDEKKDTHLVFKFSESLKEFLLELNEYVQIDRLEVNNMKSKYSIRLFQLLKMEFQKREKHMAIVPKVYAVTHLREIFGLTEKYLAFKSFNQFVLKKAIKEIREQTSLWVDVSYIRSYSKNVEKIEFKIRRQNQDPNQGKLDFSGNKPVQEMSRADIAAKRKEFDYEKFRKKYRRQHYDIEQSIHKEFEGGGANKQAVANAVRNQCERWFVKNT